MNDGDQYFGKKKIISKFFRNVHGWFADSSSPEVVRRGRMGTCADSGTLLNFFFVVCPFSMSVKGPPKTHFSGTFKKPEASKNQ